MTFPPPHERTARIQLREVFLEGVARAAPVRRRASTGPDHRIDKPNPPSTLRTVPLMYAAAGESRKAATPASSAGSPKRPSGIWVIAPSRAGAGIARPLGVAIMPGITALQRIPRGPHSAASVRAIPTIPAFDAP